MTNEVNVNATKKDAPKILPFEVQDGFEISTSAPEHIPCLVNQLLLEVGVSMVTAKPKCGKSSLLRTLAVAIAEQTPFLGFDVPSGGDVLYLNLEGPRGVVGQHFKKLGLSGANGRIHLVDERMPLKGELGLLRLEETIRKYLPLRLVVLDPASKILRLIDSFDPGQVGLAIEELEVLAKKYSLHLMFSTHAKKRATDDVGDSSMGSTSFRGGTDSNIFIVKDRKNCRIISAEQRWGDELEPRMLLQDENGASTIGDSLESVEETQTEQRGAATRQRIRKDILGALMLGSPTGPTKGELLREVNGKTVLVADVVKEMVASGEILETPDGKALRYTVPAIPIDTATQIGVAI